jgi:molybdopterin-guanine dinucleotide biosynthesis protein A
MDVPIVGLKTTSPRPGERLEDAAGDGFILQEELERRSSRDTSRMLRAGAFKAFWLQAQDSRLLAGLDALIASIPAGTAIVCDSDSARAFIEPGILIVVRHSSNGPMDENGAALVNAADLRCSFDGHCLDFRPDGLAFVGGRWLVRQNASAIILSGGQSTRIGLDKSMLSYRGKSLIGHIADQLVPMFHSVAISTNEPGKYEFLRLPMVPDIRPGLGPLMGIASALESSESELCFVIGCDIPTVNFRLVNRMLMMAEDHDIVMPRSADGRFEPLFAVYRRSVAAPALEILEAGGRRIVDLFGRVRVSFADFDGGDWYKNINTMDDYLELPGSDRTTFGS